MKMLFLILTLFAFNAFAGAPHATMATSSVSQAGGEVLAANKSRKAVIIKNNNGTGTLTVNLDATPANDDDGFKIGTEPLELPVSNAIHAKSSEVGGSDIAIIEVFQ